MPNSLEQLYLVLRFIVPGLIILFVRSQFVTGRRHSHSEEVLSYVTVSLIYYALIFPFVEFDSEKEGFGFRTSTGVWLLQVFVGPAALGFLLGVNIEKALFHRFLRVFHLNPVHGVPTAWDWKFKGIGRHWVLVTLKNGTIFAGFCSSNSSMSSDPNERDLYIEKVYEIDNSGKWKPRGDVGVLITGGEISTIELWPDKKKEDTNDAKSKID